MLHQAGMYQLCLHLFPPRLVRNYPSFLLSQFPCPFHDVRPKKKEKETTKIKEKAAILHGKGAEGKGAPSAQLLPRPNSLKVPHPLRNMLSSYSIPTPEQPTPPQQHTTTRSWKWNHNNNKRVIKVNTSREGCQRGWMPKRVCFAFGAGRPS